jgi:hypothetical protein
MPTKRRSTGSGPGWVPHATAAAALITAVGSLVGGLAATGVIGGTGDDGARVSQTVPSVPTVTAPDLAFTPTPSEERLARLIPPLFQADCRRPSEAVRDFLSNALAILVCNPPIQRDATVVYGLFSSSNDAEEHIDTSLGDKSKRCGKSASGSSTYTDAEKQTAGNVVCFVRRQEAWIEWTADRHDVFAYAYRPDAKWNDLFNLWLSSGPVSS